jgi:hypothetical protein
MIENLQVSMIDLQPQADSFLRIECGAGRLPDEAARSLEGRFFAAGWQLTVETPLARRRLNVYADHHFPFQFVASFLSIAYRFRRGLTSKKMA